MGQAWKNERGMTLLEMMAAVVILVLVAIPLTSIGTTVYRWYKEDEQKNRGVLVAEQRILEVKNELEQTGYTSTEESESVEYDEPDNLQTKVKMFPQELPASDGTLIAYKDLVVVQVEVTGPDLAQPSERTILTTLTTTVRKKSGLGGTP
ncbi:PilW family protein [Tumebacillus permanentifrigoris]|uniref:Prepilin-type N-terminal cleavage/methylation domain-containing protein n=1 Tax=Tumebacillus permanentifrigoris TaxID=378543 RepID=A0A316D3Q1_9BACL|nr:type II secretion system protein [Tumebacillus permanentifrigoris]PWK06252.1 prepilin-type N-terminal cleavage/methylation domain-containing protein [Tumebacillus permanentifrigoris]